MAREKNALSPKRARFVAEYMIDFNATQAAIRAGYSPHRADVQGARLLGNAGVRAAIEARQARLQRRLEVTQEKVVLELARLAFCNAKELFSWGPDGVKLKNSDELPDDVAAAVAEVAETKFGIRLKLHDKKGALDSLARHLGMFKGEGLPDVYVNVVIADARQQLQSKLDSLASRVGTAGVPGELVR